MKTMERAHGNTAGTAAVLVVEDENDIRALLLFHLRKAGYLAWGAETGEKALEMIRANPPGLVILDIMLPGMDGVALCRRLKRDPLLAAVPVLMLTAKGEEYDVVGGLDAGADDYAVKPFSPPVLLARVRTLLRRAGDAGGAGLPHASGGTPVARLDAPMVRGPVRLDPARREVRVNGRPVELTATEFKLLQHLMRRPGVVFSRSQLLDLVHGELHAVTDRAVDVQVVGLRRKLGAAGEWVETVRGAGYRFASNPTGADDHSA